MNEELDRALAELRNPTDSDAYLRAFGTLLHSENIAAVCQALDDYQHAEALTRFGGDNPLKPLANEVRFAARDLLRRPPTPGDEDTRPGANHTSALNAMSVLAEDEDADLIADALEGATDLNVRSAGFRAAAAALMDESEPNPRLLAVIGAMIFDETLDVIDRRNALSALDWVGTPEVDDLLVRASGSSELELQTSTALRLTMPGGPTASGSRVWWRPGQKTLKATRALCGSSSWASTASSGPIPSRMTWTCGALMGS